MKKSIYMIIIGVIILGFSYLYSHIDKNNYIYDRNMDTGSFYGTGLLKDGEEIKQKFFSEDETIDGINVKITKVGNVENVVLHYFLIDEQGETIVEESIAASQLENNKFNQLEIPRVMHAKGKQYTLVLCVENSDEQNGLSFYVVPGEQDNQQLTIMGNEAEGMLAVRIICHRFDTETFVVLLGIFLFIGTFMKRLYKSFR